MLSIRPYKSGHADYQPYAIHTVIPIYFLPFFLTICILFAMDEALKSKLELVLIAYKSTYDLELSYVKSNVSDKERGVLEQDQDFQRRINSYLFDKKESIILTLENLSYSAETDKLRLEATLHLGRLIFPVDFNPVKRVETKSGFIAEDLAQENLRLKKEYEYLLESKK